jgi:phosphate acyltransferase
VDVGANVDSKAKFLVDYAIMGEIYARLIQRIDRPRVALLNVGEEESKGTEVVREAHELLRHRQLNFIGNCEGRDILSGEVDVIVCDGFEGNIVLKFAESVLGFLKDKLRRYAEGSVFRKLAMAALAPILRGALKDMDYQEYGGVPLLGINGVVIIGHGSSSPKAIANMIRRAVEVVERDVNGHIRAAVAQTGTSSAKEA